MHGAKDIKKPFYLCQQSSLADIHQHSHSHNTYVTISYFTSTISFYFCSLLSLIQWSLLTSSMEVFLTCII